MTNITVSEALGWLKTLKARHAELVNLRNENSAIRVNRYGSEQQEIKPQYDVKKLDKRVSLIAREIRVVDEAIKRFNATSGLPGYVRNDDVLGELEDA
jgi:type I restriction-modification system DNA methylase subunit